MKPASRLGRRWRSVSFRSGLVAALSVGVVATLALLLISTLVFVLFALSGAVAETTLVDRAEDQLRLGVEPGELNLSTTIERGGPSQEGGDAFWAVLIDDQVVNGEGDLNRAVLDADFSDPSIEVEFNAQPRPGDLLGIKTVDGQDWFYLEREVSAPGGQNYRVVTAYDGTFSWWRFVRSSFPVSLPVIAALMAVAMAVTSWQTRRALRRVEHMRAEVEQITQQSLDRRVPTVDASDGIARLAHTMNDMLSRLESASAQQSQFLADASHELRSPVTGLLAQLDIAATYPDKVDHETLVPKLRDEAQRLQLLVDDLLFLSRSEASSALAEASPTTVSVDALINAEMAHQRAVDGSTNLVVGEPSEAHVTGNPRDLERALRNLVDNAVRHHRNEVRLSADVAGEQVVIAVSDDGPGVGPEDRERIFRRFVRLDEARSRDAGGAGLGLAIASEIAARHGGTVRLEPTSGPGARFELTLPLGD